MSDGSQERKSLEVPAPEGSTRRRFSDPHPRLSVVSINRNGEGSTNNPSENENDSKSTTSETETKMSENTDATTPSFARSSLSQPPDVNRKIQAFEKLTPSTPVATPKSPVVLTAPIGLSVKDRMKLFNAPVSTTINQQKPTAQSNKVKLGKITKDQAPPSLLHLSQVVKAVERGKPIAPDVTPSVSNEIPLPIPEDSNVDLSLPIANSISTRGSKRSGVPKIVLSSDKFKSDELMEKKQSQEVKSAISSGVYKKNPKFQEKIGMFEKVAVGKDKMDTDSEKPTNKIQIVSDSNSSRKSSLTNATASIDSSTPKVDTTENLEQAVDISKPAENVVFVDSPQGITNSTSISVSQEVASTEIGHDASSSENIERDSSVVNVDNVLKEVTYISTSDNQETVAIHKAIQHSEDVILDRVVSHSQDDRNQIDFVIEAKAMPSGSQEDRNLLDSVSEEKTILSSSEEDQDQIKSLSEEKIASSCSQIDLVAVSATDLRPSPSEPTATSQGLEHVVTTELGDQQPADKIDTLKSIDSPKEEKLAQSAGVVLGNSIQESYVANCSPSAPDLGDQPHADKFAAATSSDSLKEEKLAQTADVILESSIQESYDANCSSSSNSEPITEPVKLVPSIAELPSIIPQEEESPPIASSVESPVALSVSNSKPDESQMSEEIRMTPPISQLNPDAESSPVYVSTTPADDTSIPTQDPTTEASVVDTSTSTVEQPSEEMKTIIPKANERESLQLPPVDENYTPQPASSSTRTADHQRTHSSPEGDFSNPSTFVPNPTGNDHSSTASYLNERNVSDFSIDSEFSPSAPKSSSSVSIAVQQRQLGDIGIIVGHLYDVVNHEDEDSKFLASSQSGELSEMKTISEEELKRFEHKRSLVRDELIKSESSYINGLQILITKFARPIKAQPKHGVTQDHAGKIFSNIEIIAHFHDKLYAELKVKSNSVGGIFKKYADFLRMYTQYLNGYESSLSVINGLSDSKAFKAFLESRRNDPEVKLDLMSYLIMPVQRIPRYELLLREYLTNTPEGHPEREVLEIAFEKVQTIAQHINESKRRMENMSKVLAIQNKIEGNLGMPLLAPHRRLIKEGHLEVRRAGLLSASYRKRVLFLFNDSLLTTAENYAFKDWILIDTESFHIERLDEIDGRFGFAIDHNEYHEKYYSLKEAERDEWVALLFATKKAYAEVVNAAKERQFSPKPSKPMSNDFGNPAVVSRNSSTSIDEGSTSSVAGERMNQTIGFLSPMRSRSGSSKDLTK